MTTRDFILGKLSHGPMTTLGLTGAYIGDNLATDGMTIKEVKSGMYRELKDAEQDGKITFDGWCGVWCIETKKRKRHADKT